MQTCIFGIVLGHTYIVTKNGHDVVDKFPLEIAVAGADDADPPRITPPL